MEAQTHLRYDYINLPIEFTFSVAVLASYFPFAGGADNGIEEVGVFIFYGDFTKLHEQLTNIHLQMLRGRIRD